MTTVALAGDTLRAAPSATGVVAFRAALTLAALLPLLLRPRATYPRAIGLAIIGPFLLLCFASMLWADNLELSMQANLILTCEVLTGIGLASWCSGRELVRVLITCGGVIALSSLLSVLLLPRYGVHQVVDIGLNPGAWRGVYAHKNMLGHMCAAFFVFGACTPSSYFGGHWKRALFMAGQLALVVGSTSAGAIVVIVGGLAAYACAYKAPTGLRALIVLVTPAAIWLGQVATGAVLEALGRDETMSGRTLIWQIGWQYLNPKMLFGYGFGATTYGGFARTVLQWLGVDSPHNGYMDLALSIGVSGLGLFIIGIGGAIYLSSRTVERFDLRYGSALIFSWLISGFSEAAFRPGGGLAAITYPLLSAMACIALTQRQGGGRPAEHLAGERRDSRAAVA